MAAPGLTGHAPGSQGVAQLFLHDLVVAYPHDRIACFTVGAIMPSGSPDLEWLPSGFAPRRWVSERFIALPVVAKRNCNQSSDERGLT